ncbi:MAG: hypothetical protein LWW96_18955 [Acidovorax sp.]|uniref:hypothetical protein n=1 Tax=Acidovorax sp. TaxID=1872122 RepID=UPI0025BC025F|nr:hypothetical protein [Acidovorax sp.]MCE1194229.1 hypothetical protein [Acidovorax sp.]
MTVAAILAELIECGITPGLTPDGRGIEVPAGRLTDAQRTAIKAHKPELIASIQASVRMASELLAAAMRACDAHGDSPQAREQMRLDCLETPPHLRADLLQHLRATYPASSRVKRHPNT